MRIGPSDVDLTLMILVYERAMQDDALPTHTQNQCVEFLRLLMARRGEVLDKTVETELADSINKRHYEDLAREQVYRIGKPSDES